MIKKEKNLIQESNPKISVCMASFNGEHYIKDQINSILSCLNERDELVISDDGSADETVRIIEGLKDKKIKLFINSGRPRGCASNFEYALSQASGDYVFLSDQDDIWYENKVSKIMPVLCDADLVISNAAIQYDANNVNKHRTAADLFALRYPKSNVFSNIYSNSYTGCTLAFNRRVLSLALPLPLPHNIMHDHWIATIVLAGKGKIAVIDEPLMAYRVHAHNQTATGYKNVRRTFFRKLYDTITRDIFKRHFWQKKIFKPIRLFFILKKRLDSKGVLKNDA